MQTLIESGRIVDIVLAVLLAEVLLLALWHRRTGRGIAPLPAFLNAGAGGSLALALRAALTDSGWMWVTAWLLCALVFHSADLARRWSREKVR
ncbi:MAG TPA: hypothetical protein VJ883_09425 [Woeseiaceae bacterium]|nr:hypothetical protein [Woeseiaceae bacterium]